MPDGPVGLPQVYDRHLIRCTRRCSSPFFERCLQATRYPTEEAERPTTVSEQAALTADAALIKFSQRTDCIVVASANLQE